MSLSGVKTYLARYGLDKRIIELDESSATVAQAAHALNIEEGRVAKTLSLLVNGEPIVIVVSGISKIDNRKYKQVFGTKAKMIAFDEVEKLTTHPVGGVCPFDLPQNIKVYLDVSLKKYQTVFPACGSGNSAIEMSGEELEKTSRYVSWIDVATEA